MKMARGKLVLKLMLLLWLTHFCTSAFGDDNSYVQDACSVTRYPALCIHSLASFSSKAKRNPTTWARAGVSVTIDEAKSVAQLLSMVKRQSLMRGRSQAALSDCVELVQDTLDKLHMSLGELRKLNGQSFEKQMGDVTTWLSAALTDEETCLDGFEGEEGGQVSLLRNKVSNVSCVTSNALALVNKLATSGPQSLSSTDP